MLRHHLGHALAAAVLATAAAGPLTMAAPAAAATCDPGTGVSVVVDFKGLGGGAQSVCDAAGGGQKAATLFTRNGFDLTYAQRQPGYVCRVDNVPASDPCINTSPASAYWGLWWSDGKSGTWSYSSLGATSLTIPAGGSVAFAWDDVDGSVKPGVAPPKQAASSPSPTPSPSAAPTKTPGSSPTVKPTPTPTPVTTPTSAPSATPSEVPTATESASPTPTQTSSATPSASATPLAGDAPTPTPSPSEPTSVETAAAEDDGGLPVWVPVLVIMALFGGAAALVLRRRVGGS